MGESPAEVSLIDDQRDKMALNILYKIVIQTYAIVEKHIIQVQVVIHCGSVSGLTQTIEFGQRVSTSQMTLPPFTNNWSILYFSSSEKNESGFAT
jgi:hypothetical protein